MPLLKNRILGYTNERPLVADLFLQNAQAPVILFVHGFKGFKDWGAWNKMAEYFYDKGYHFIKFNLSHNGGTAEIVEDFPDLVAFGENNFNLELSDISAVLDSLEIRTEFEGLISRDRIAVIGHSRGGAMSLLSAIEDKRVKAVITLNAVTDIISWIYNFDIESWRTQGEISIYNGRTQQEMPMHRQFLDDFEQNRDRYDIMNRSEDLRIPMLVIHCSDDQIVNVEQALSLHAIVPTSSIYILDQGGHTLGASHPFEFNNLPIPLSLACSRVNRFLRELGWIGE